MYFVVIYIFKIISILLFLPLPYDIYLKKYKVEWKKKTEVVV